MLQVNVLWQAWLSNRFVDSFSLVSDTNYVRQNIGRILRALFQMLRTRGWISTAERVLTMCKMADLRQWDTSHTLTQFHQLKRDILGKLQSKVQSIIVLLCCSMMTKVTYRKCRWSVYWICQLQRLVHL